MFNLHEEDANSPFSLLHSSFFLLFLSSSVPHSSLFFPSTFSCPLTSPPPPGMVVLSQLGCGLEGSGSSLPSPRLQQQHQPQIQVMQQLWHYPPIDILISDWQLSDFQAWLLNWCLFNILLEDINKPQVPIINWQLYRKQKVTLCSQATLISLILSEGLTQTKGRASRI